MKPVPLTTFRFLLASLISLTSGLKLPKFSWDHVPVFIHMCNGSGPFNDTTVNFLSKFPMITIEKGQGVFDKDPNSPQFVEDRILNVAKAIRKVSPSSYVIYYMNTILDWVYYRLHPVLVAHPQWQLHDKNGSVVRIRGGHNFPQPENGMLVFDVAQKVVQDFWNADCMNMTKTGYIVGCFADRADYNRFQDNLTPAQLTKFVAGHDQMITDLQRELNESNAGVLIVNQHSNLHIPGMTATQIENFAAKEESINKLLNYTRSGWVVQAHAENVCDDITDSLAAFLIGAGEYSYYACSSGWYVQDGWLKWFDEYDKPLGKPLSDAVKKGDVYTREFASGTKVTFDVSSNVGTITWAR